MKLKRIIKHILFLYCLLIISGCSYTSKISNMTNEDIENKLSNSISCVEIYSIFGNPTCVYVNKQGYKEVVYRYENKDTKKGIKRKQNKNFNQLIIIFNKEGYLYSYKISEVEEDNIIK